MVSTARARPASAKIAEKHLNATKRNERQALKALGKLCDHATPVEDVLTVDEVRALPRIETVEVV